MAQTGEYIVRTPYRAERIHKNGQRITRLFHQSDVIEGPIFPETGEPAGVLAGGKWPIPLEKVQLVRMLAQNAEKHMNADGEKPQQEPSPKAPDAGTSPSSEPEESTKAAAATKKIEDSSVVKNIVDKSHGTVKGMMWGGMAGLVIGFVCRRPVAGAMVGIAIGGMVGNKWLTKDQIENLMMSKK